MSSTLLDRPTARPATPVPTAAPAAPRALRPVGARFPRTWMEPEVAPPTLHVEPLRVFPVGCRFLRRTAADHLTYQTPAEPAPQVRPLPSPVGARFPRRTRTAA